jgi:hypothetical protein
MTTPQLDTLFPDVTGTSPIAWSPDGEYLLLVTFEKGIHINNIVHLSEMSGTSILEVVDSASGDQVIQHWLGVNDLFVASKIEEISGDTVFYIAEIIDGTWHSTEFLRFPDSDFPIIQRGDWHLTATEAEKHTLSCLFDQALPTRLSIGTRARVNFTDGTPLRLRTEPNFEATEITHMPEGTAFDMIGGPACVNSELYYRFWQLELDDGTVGWAAEANNTDYFIEPIEEVE